MNSLKSKYARPSCLYFSKPVPGRSYDDATFSDAIVRCGGKEFKVHKLVLAAHSKFFSKAFTGDWKVPSLLSPPCYGH